MTQTADLFPIFSLWLVLEVLHHKTTNKVSLTTYQRIINTSRTNGQNGVQRHAKRNDRRRHVETNRQPFGGQRQQHQGAGIGVVLLVVARHQTFFLFVRTYGAGPGQSFAEQCKDGAFRNAFQPFQFGAGFTVVFGDGVIHCKGQQVSMGETWNMKESGRKWNTKKVEHEESGTEHEEGGTWK